MNLDYKVINLISIFLTNLTKSNLVGMNMKLLSNIKKINHFLTLEKKNLSKEG
jgi:hypothetical protein